MSFEPNVEEELAAVRRTLAARGKWDDEAIAKLREHVNEKWKTKSCPACAANAWTMHGFVNLVTDPSTQSSVGMAFPGLGFLGGVPSMPCAAMVCLACGLTLLVNLLVAGVVKLPEVAATSALDPTPAPGGSP